MINNYQERSVEIELHSQPHKLYKYDDGTSESICECDRITTVQAVYDFAGSHVVRLHSDANDTYRNSPVYLTADQARELASHLMFAANDADTLNRDFA
jgi:hypothetical protein